ncbi:hypothetical protein AB1Y20_009117 [Prymnesium parvum]|uniref:Phosphoglycerate kinase n=1 Tax=Prymnesium parvum TaxID=97485 RepID=A0AB34K3L6_PRYPA
MTTLILNNTRALNRDNYPKQTTQDEVDPFVLYALHEFPADLVLLGDDGGDCSVARADVSRRSRRPRSRSTTRTRSWTLSPRSSTHPPAW